MNGLEKLLRDIDRPDLVGEGLTDDVATAISDAYPPPSRNGHGGAEADRKSAFDRPTVLEKLRASLVQGDEIKALPRPEPLVDGVLDLDSLAVLYGRSGAGKSFVANDLALSIATGTWWHRRAVTAGPVLYIVAEGTAGIGARVEAWQQHQRVHTTGEMTWLTAAPNLLDRDHLAAVEEIVRDLEPRLIIGDTLARLIPGGDENSHQTMSTVIEAADRLRRASGACVLLVHHTGKDAGAGARGHSSLLGAVDTEIACDGAENVVALKATKQKHHADGHLIERFRLLEVGESCALAPYTGTPELDGKLSRSEEHALEVLGTIAVPEGISATTWCESCELPRRTFFDVRARLLRRGLIEQPAKARYAPTTATSASASAGAE